MSSTLFGRDRCAVACALLVVAVLPACTVGDCAPAATDAPDASHWVSSWCPVSDPAECEILGGELCRRDNCTAWIPTRGDYCVTGDAVPTYQLDLDDPDGDGYAVIGTTGGGDWWALRSDGC